MFTPRWMGSVSEWNDRAELEANGGLPSQAETYPCVKVYADSAAQWY